MGDPSEFQFSFKEVVEALVKQQGIHEGIWELAAKFGLKAVNSGPSDDQMMPTAVIPLMELGLRRTKTVHNLAVDAAKVNPASKTRPSIASSPKPPKPKR